MAFDYGTNSLGIENPFKFEGIVRSIFGGAICMLSLWALLGVPQALKSDMSLAWIKAILGIILMTWGLRSIGSGLFQLFKFFVGRSVPTSLAYNKNLSEKENAEAEKNVTAYKSENLESMLMGRKNTTFIEPQGWLARMVHSLLPRLLFMPYPIRNLIQELSGLMVSLLIAVTAFTVAYIISKSGLTGGAGRIITPILSFLLLLYLTSVCHLSAKSLVYSNNHTLHEKSASNLATLLSLSILLPILIGFIYQKFSPQFSQKLNTFIATVLPFDAWFNLILLLIVFSVIFFSAVFMVRERFKLSVHNTEVAEHRENMQESIHPNEIFINIDNIVLANRRYKEIPNRVYQEFDPVLNEQSQGKGIFKGNLLIETQPEYQNIEYSQEFKRVRAASTILSQLLIFISAWLLLLFVLKAHEVYAYIFKASADVIPGDTAGATGQLDLVISSCLTLFFSFTTILYGGKILEKVTHPYWSEMQFESLLMWMKTEGTYTESKVATGMSIHDSTRSENVVVRSSITPWLITSRITTSTFATSGMKNLEMPRYIMSMEKNVAEMNQIVSEIKDFLRGRETIASISNEKDLGNVERIFIVNQATKTQTELTSEKSHRKLLEEEAAAKRIQESKIEET